MELNGLVVITWWMLVPLILVGALLHFAYDWFGRSRLAAILGAVNESYWEHVKITIWPVALFHIVLFALGGYRHPAFIPAATIALYSIPVSMIGLVFLYKEVTRRNVLWIDIAVFAVSIVLAQAIFTGLLLQLQPDAVTVILAAGFLLGLLTAILTFTLRPPREPDIFIDPITKQYGESALPEADG